MIEGDLPIRRVDSGNRSGGRGRRRLLFRISHSGHSLHALRTDLGR